MVSPEVPAGGDAGVFNTYLPLLAIVRHFPSLDFSFLSVCGGVLCESAQLFGSDEVGVGGGGKVGAWPGKQKC